MSRNELLGINAELREALSQIAHLAELEFDDQDDMNVDELEDENNQLEATLREVRSLADEAVGNELDSE